MQDFEKQKRFGRYLILDEVSEEMFTHNYRARLLEEHVNKFFTVKILKPEYKEDKDLLKNILDGNKVNLKLSHPCINQIYEYGHHDGEYFSIS